MIVIIQIISSKSSVLISYQKIFNFKDVYLYWNQENVKTII